MRLEPVPMDTVKVVAKDYLFTTLQGEGIRVGAPSVFLRLYGCGSSCSWCDTKQSWQPGSSFLRYPDTTLTLDVLARLKHVRSLVVTGGDPMLQQDVLVRMLREIESRSIFDTGERPHVTLETQGNIVDRSDNLLRHVSLLSLSPKLHEMGVTTPSPEILQWVSSLFYHRECRDVQFKIVVENGFDVRRALQLFSILQREFQYLRDGYEGPNTHFILQPEFSKGARFVSQVFNSLIELSPQFPYTAPEVRVIPQIHKLAFKMP